MYIIYIITLYGFLFGNITKYTLSNETFKIWLFRFLQIFYGLTMERKV